MNLHGFSGERHELDRLVGLKIISANYNETETSESVLDIDLVDEGGQKYGLRFIDGSWYYGAELTQEQKIEALGQRITELENMLRGQPREKIEGIVRLFDSLAQINQAK